MDVWAPAEEQIAFEHDRTRPVQDTEYLQPKGKQPYGDGTLGEATAAACRVEGHIFSVGKTTPDKLKRFLNRVTETMADGWHFSLMANEGWFETTQEEGGQQLEMSAGKKEMDTYLAEMKRSASLLGLILFAKVGRKGQKNCQVGENGFIASRNPDLFHLLKEDVAFLKEH